MRFNEFTILPPFAIENSLSLAFDIIEMRYIFLNLSAVIFGFQYVQQLEEKFIFNLA
jgi:hypothetical protein